MSKIYFSWNQGCVVWLLNDGLINMKLSLVKQY